MLDYPTYRIIHSFDIRISTPQLQITKRSLMNHQQQYDQRQKQFDRDWISISPKQVVLHGILLSSSFNIQNFHEHLSVKFLIKAYLNGHEASKYIEVFPNKGNIMRGEIKKVRVKHSKEIQPALQDVIHLRLFVSLNTQFNKQYMKVNRLSGWEGIKNLPVQQFVIPVLISDQYKTIKEGIRQNVLFSSQFGKVSQDFSSLYGEENFDLPEDKMNLVAINQRQPRLSEYRRPNNINEILVGQQSRRRSGSEKKKYRQKANPFQIKIIQNQAIIERQNNNYQWIHRSRSSDGRSKKKIETNKVLSKPFRSSQNFLNQGIFNNHQLDPVINHKTRKNIALRNMAYNEQQNSEDSILRSLQNSEAKFRQNSEYKSFLKSEYHQQNKNQNSNNSFYKNKSIMTPTNSNMNRNIQIMILAVISGFFVALGANIGQFFSQI